MPKSKNRRKPKRNTGATAKSRPESASAGPSTASRATIAGDVEEPKAKKKSVGPIEFFRQVRAEAQKITWTSRNETMVSTVMVLIMVAVASLFFLVVDQALRFVVPYILSFNI